MQSRVSDRAAVSGSLASPRGGRAGIVTNRPSARRAAYRRQASACVQGVHPLVPRPTPVSPCLLSLLLVFFLLFFIFRFFSLLPCALSVRLSLSRVALSHARASTWRRQHPLLPSARPPAANSRCILLSASAPRLASSARLASSSARLASSAGCRPLQAGERDHCEDEADEAGGRERRQPPRHPQRRRGQRLELASWRRCRRARARPSVRCHV